MKVRLLASLLVSSMLIAPGFAQTTQNAGWGSGGSGNNSGGMANGGGGGWGSGGGGNNSGGVATNGGGGGWGSGGGGNNSGGVATNGGGGGWGSGGGGSSNNGGMATNGGGGGWGSGGSGNNNSGGMATNGGGNGNSNSSSGVAQNGGGGTDQNEHGGNKQVSFLRAPPPSAWRASRLMGMPVYGSHDLNIGDVNDILINPDGQIEAIVVGIGGFLGIGQKDIAIPFSVAQWREEGRAGSNGPNGYTGPVRMLISLTKAQVQGAPYFQYVSTNENEGRAKGGSNTGGGRGNH